MEIQTKEEWKKINDMLQKVSRERDDLRLTLSALDTDLQYYNLYRELPGRVEEKLKAWRPEPNPPPEVTFRSEIRGVLNKFSVENVSNTPDLVLASFLVKCLNAFNEAVVSRANLLMSGREKNGEETTR